MTTSVRPDTRCAGLHDLDDQALGHVAGFFRALADPLRLKILGELRQGPLCVSELTERLGCSQANVSKHLGTLAGHGLVIREPHRTRALYRVDAAIAYPLCNLVCDQVGRQLSAAAQLSARFLRTGPAAAGPSEA